MSHPSFREMFEHLWRADRRGRAARTVEAFGWLILVEGSAILLAPGLMISLLALPPVGDQGMNYVRLVGLLVSGVGMLYVVSGRLNAEGFVFASLLDRPLVPVVMLVLWTMNAVPGTVALAFAMQDFASFLWTLKAWRAESG
jgi:hypothetical protein